MLKKDGILKKGIFVGLTTLAIMTMSGCAQTNKDVSTEEAESTSVVAEEMTDPDTELNDSDVELNDPAGDLINTDTDLIKVNVDIIDTDSDYFYDQLNDAQKALFDQMREQSERFYYGNEEPDIRKSLSGSDVICYGDFDKGNLQDYEFEQVAQYFILSCPRYFFIDDRQFFKENGEYAFILTSECNSREMIDFYREKIEEKTKEWLDKVKDLDDDLEKEKAAYQFIIENAEYDSDSAQVLMELNSGLYENISKYDWNTANIAGFFEDGKVVCDGYARTMQYLCNAVGVDSLYVENGTSEHAWNMVKLYDEWYCIDVTWMDASGDASEDSNLVNKSLDTFRGKDMDQDDPMKENMFRYHSANGFIQTNGPKCTKDIVEKL